MKYDYNNCSCELMFLVKKLLNDSLEKIQNTPTGLCHQQNGPLNESKRIFDRII